jgi:hypothetical protein
VATRSLNAWRSQEYSRGFSSERERHICTPSLERQENYEGAAHGWNIMCFIGETIMEASCLASPLPAQPTHFVATRDQITIVHCAMQVTGRSLLLPEPYAPALFSGSFWAHCPPMSHPLVLSATTMFGWLTYLCHGGFSLCSPPTAALAWLCPVFPVVVLRCLACLVLGQH